MAVENITLNIIPTGDTPSIHVAQFDVDRPFTITLKEGADDFTPTDYTIELQVRKVDATIVTVLPTSTSGNVVTFNTTEQMTACSGTNLAEVQLTKDSQTFATLHFYLVVQRDVLAGGVTSESDIYNLTEQIAAIVPEVIGDDYYNKEEVDEKIAEIPTFDPTNYYDKSETDALLDDKANVSDLPDMTDYYTKSEVDTKITDLYQIKTASGSIAHFTDGGNDIPVKLLTSEIVAVESGNGQPKSPTNPYTISGFDNGIITRWGKNLFDYTQLTSARDWTESGGVYSGAIGNLYAFARNGFPIQPKWITNQQYVFKLKVNNAEGNSRFRFVYTDNTHSDLVITPVTIGTYVSVITAINKTVSNLIFYYNQGGNLSISEMCLELGTSASTFEPYEATTYTFTFGQTVYGGYFDNKGNLVVTHGYIASYNGETINEPWVSSMDNYVPNTSPSTGAQVVYPLATPITLSITSQAIPTLSGENNIFSKTGDVEVEYFTEKSDGIAELIKAFM